MKNNKYVVASIRVSRELWKKVKKHAIDEGVTLTELVERLLREELAKSSKDQSF